MQQLIPSCAGEYREKIEIWQVIVAYRGAQRLAQRQRAQLFRPRQKTVDIVARLEAEHGHARVYPAAKANRRREQHERVKAPLHDEQQHGKKEKPGINNRCRRRPIGVHTNGCKPDEHTQRGGDEHGKRDLQPQAAVYAPDDSGGQRHSHSHPFRFIQRLSCQESDASRNRKARAARWRG